MQSIPKDAGHTGANQMMPLQRILLTRGERPKAAVLKGRVLGSGLRGQVFNQYNPIPLRSAATLGRWDLKAFVGGVGSVGLLVWSLRLRAFRLRPHCRRCCQRQSQHFPLDLFKANAANVLVKIAIATATIVKTKTKPDGQNRPARV